MHPGIHALSRADRPAAIMTGSGDIVTYAELEAASNRFAHLLRSRGFAPGSHIAVFLDNDRHYCEIVWAALRSGIYVTPINWHLGAAEAAYIVDDCDARALVTTGRFAEVISTMADSLTAVDTRLVVNGSIPGFEDLATAVADQPLTPIDDETEGSIMFYSSGTTGHPKGIRAPLSGDPLGSNPALVGLMERVYGFTSESVYLTPAPLYHAAPLGWSVAMQRMGGTVVTMESFDSEAVLATIERHQVTHAQFVPTHFVRMLALPAEVRARYDLSSLEVVIHAAAPCPIDVKRQMLDWFGPIVHEYYAGSEAQGFCAIGPQEWLENPGSVGRAILGHLHILSDEGVELAPGEVGTVWFESHTRFEYHKDPARTAEAFNDAGWSTLGDMGYVDAEGHLYLTDRVSHMIISGGVNISPQEIEDLLSTHAAVADVAVIGVPDAEMGEQVRAVVQLVPGVIGSPELERELIDLCRAGLARYKCPRAVDFVDELPRLPTGKLLKRRLREQYREAAER